MKDRLTIDWVVRQRAEDMIRMYAEGKSLREIGKAVKLSHVRVRTILLEQEVTLRPAVFVSRPKREQAATAALAAAISAHHPDRCGQ